MEDKEINKSSANNVIDPEVLITGNAAKELIGDIFHKPNEGNSKFFVKNSNFIPNLLEFLAQDIKEKSSIVILEKIELINFLTRNFLRVSHNQEIFTKFKIYSKNSFSYFQRWNIFHILIELYLRELDQLFVGLEEDKISTTDLNNSDELSEKLQKSILDCLEVLINNIVLKKEVMEYVYQKFSVYYRVLNKFPNDKYIHSRNLVNKFIQLLKILYGERLNISKPYNYFYFSGNGSLKVLDNSLQEEKIKLNNGFVFSFWFKPLFNFTDSKNPNSECDLVTVKCNTKDNQKLQVSLVNNKLFLKNFSDKEHVHEFPNEQWSHISFIIKPKSFLKNTEIILITEKNISNYPIPSFNSDCEVTDITFFQKFVGQVTSIMFLGKAVSEEYVKLLRQLPYGIHKEKILQRFMKSAYNRYLTNSNQKFSNLPYAQKDSEGIANIIDNIKFCYTPFRFSTTQTTNPNLIEKTIYDLCGKYNAGFLNYDCISGVHSYHSYQKNIFFLGGINNIIPLVEMIMCNGNLLDNQTFLNLMELINVILNYRKKNMNDAVNKNFFPMLSLFLEKFPNELYQENILRILLTIGRSLFAFVDECKLSKIYFEYILLNEKIFTKFSIHLQSDLWRSLYQFYVSDVSQIKSFMGMSKVCLVLRYYDLNRFHEYCCKEHADVFDQEKENESFTQVMKPDMKDKVDNIINIVHLIVEENILEEIHSLMKLLALDLSPCLQKYIIKVFVDYFNVTNFNKMNEVVEKKQKILNYLINNNFIDTLLYVISVSLVDVRCECLKLFTNLSNEYFKDIMKKPLEKICTFLKEFILPFNYSSIKMSNPLDGNSTLLQNKKERSLGLYPNSEKEMKKYNTTLNKNKLIKINPSLAEKQSDSENPEKKKTNTIEKINEKALFTAKHSTKSSFSFDSNKLEEFINSTNITTKSVSIPNETKDDNKENKDIQDNKEIILESPARSTLPIEFETKAIKKSNISIKLNDDENKKPSIKKPALKLKLPEKKLAIKDLDTSSQNEKTLHSSRSENIDLKSFNISETSDSNLNTENSHITNLENEDNTENKPKRTIKHHLKSISVDMNVDKSSSVPSRKNQVNTANTLKERKFNVPKIKLDVDNINKIYKFGGDKNEINVSEEEKNYELDIQIRMLAKHCIDFMNGEATKTDCLRFNYTSNNNTFQMKAMNDKNQTVQNEPRSVKAEKKIDLIKYGTFNEKIIEEDPGEMIPSSPFKVDIKELSGKKLSDKKISPKHIEALEKAKEISQELLNKKVLKLSVEDNDISSSTANINRKVNVEENIEKVLIKDKTKTEENEEKPEEKIRNTIIAQTHKTQSSKVIKIVDDYLSTSTKSLNEISLQHDKELENLTNHFNKEVYNHNLTILFESCFDWLVGKKNLKKKSFSDDSQIIKNDKRGSLTPRNTTYLDEDAILNPQVIDIIISMAVNTDVTYLQKLMQDFYLIMLNHKENCSILYKNCQFYTWLIETTFKHYQKKLDIEKKLTDDSTALSLSIYEQGKRIHTELIMNTIMKEDKLKTEPMNKINFLLSWGLYYKNLYDYNRKINLEVNDFIKNLLRDILNVFKEKLAVCSPNISLAIWENFASFSILSYEFMTFYNLEKTLKNNSISFADLLYEKLIVPRCILSGLHLDSSDQQEDQSQHSTNHSKKESDIFSNTSVKDLWSDYAIFESIYLCYSPLFILNKTILNNLSLTHEENLTDNQYLKALEEFLGNKKKRDTFVEDFRVLTYYFKSDFSNKFNNYDIPVIKIISNLLAITLSVIEEENEIKFWLSQYENFLIFLIVASTNLSTITMDYYQLVQDLCIDIITFGLCFLIDETFNTRKNTKNAIYFLQTIKNVFVTCMYVLNFINKQLFKKKKKMNFISNLMKNKKKQDFTKCAIYRIFNEFVIDLNGNPIVNPARLQEMFSNGFYNFPEALKEDMWKSGLNESTLLMEKLKKVFDFKVYDLIMRERNEVIKKFVPIYENKLTVNNGLNLIASPYRDVSQALSYKNTIYKIIETMIPQYTFEIKKYNNNNFISAKRRKQILKSLKKNMFSWRGVWSDYDLFYDHPDKLKLKILNHYTSQMSRPILSAIIDLNYYVPKFSKFELTNLFHKNEQNAELFVNLDIDQILNKKNEDSRECNMDKGLTKHNSMCEPELNFNYIKAIYKLNHQTIWNSYTDLNSKMNLDKIEHEYNELYLNKFKVKSNNPELRKYENSYECCFVKQSHHIKGIFYLNKEGITFSVFLNQVIGNNNHTQCDSTTVTDNTEHLSLNKKSSFEIIERDDDYDYDRNTCFGSYFVFHHKDKNTLTFSFPYNEIRFILKRKFYYKKTGLELFSILNKSYYFNFKAVTDRDTVLKAIITHFESKREIKVDTKENVKDKEDLIIGYENTSNSSSLNKKNPKANYLSSKIESWMNWKISNLEFLMWLNIYSNRSYLDLSQYPVFPWILKNYSDKIFSLPEDMRDFDVPMGMMELDAKGKDRKILYLDTFFSMQQDKDTGDAPYMFGSHYSNPMYVAHYLTRLFPFSHIMIELQGDKFDDPNRLFLSLENSFNCATTLKGDVRELVPEFFYLPELFLNVNNLNMGVRTDNHMQKQAVANVQLPDWCDNNPYEYIIKIRTALESEEVSLVINDWVDLIFGYKQRGKEAENNFNVFIHTSYEDTVNLDLVEKDQRPYYLRMVEFGLTPNQLISSRSCVERFDKDHVRRGRQLTESKELKSLSNSQNSYKGKHAKKPLMIKLKVIDNDKVMCVYNNNTYNICKFTPSDYRYNMELVSKNYITPENTYKINCRINEYYDENLVNSPIIIYNSGKVIAQGGYWDGRITLSYSEGNAIKLSYYFTKDSPITVLAVDKEEKYLFAGSKIGVLYIFRINDITLHLETVLFDHFQEITYISVSNVLNVFATSGLDGFVNLYTFPNNKLFRSIKLKDNLPADYIFLSCNPLPSFVVYSKITKLFYCYSINGFFLCEEFDECKFIMSPNVMTDISFNDYLIYGTNTGEFKIRKFPNMQLHNKLSLADFKQKSEIIPIKCLDISEDKRFAYLWQLDEQDIILVKDPSVTSEAATVNLINMGFGY